MLDNLDKSLPELDGLSVADIKTIQDQLAASETLLKARKDAFAALMLRRFEANAKAEYTAQKKDTGTVRCAAPGSNLLELKIEVDKTVVWDQEKTLAWLNKQKPEDARHYGKLKVEIPEAKFKAATPAIQAELLPFRTLKPGKMKMTLVAKGDEDQAAA